MKLHSKHAGFAHTLSLKNVICFILFFNQRNGYILHKVTCQVRHFLQRRPAFSSIGPWLSRAAGRRRPKPQCEHIPSVFLSLCHLAGKVARGPGLSKWPDPPTVGCFLCSTLGWFLFKCGSGVRKPNVISLQHGVPKAVR